MTPDVCLVVPTYRRPKLLRCALAALRHQTDVEHARVTVVVLDNDPEESARAVVREAAALLPFAIEYLVVRERGLSNVRNAALAVARARAPFLAMLDDDEIPEPQWLAELLRVQSLTDAAAVSGPVLALVPASAPAWIRRGAFYDMPRFHDGAQLRDGCTGNALLRLRAPALNEIGFDPAFNAAGGEDQFFFRELLARGGEIVYAANAVATEQVMPNRLCAAYILRRAFRRGNTLWYCDLRILGTARVIAMRVAKALFWVTFGLASLPVRLAVRGRTGAVEALVDFARGAGMLAGAFGVLFLEYDRPSTLRYGTEM
ncbi:MAG TPA: glycosyltransferase [Candidatus Sulfotelmatobacter sp.]|nr:glycosyltransferase [Candidatus Sulfotelmatobacter sp.]